MKYRLLIALVLFAMLPMATAQKYAVVNTDYVLKSLPEYSSAQKRLDRYVADWQKELTDKAAEVESMRADYEQESYLLPENLKKRRQEEHEVIQDRRAHEDVVVPGADIGLIDADEEEHVEEDRQQRQAGRCGVLGITHAV